MDNRPIERQGRDYTNPLRILAGAAAAGVFIAGAFVLTREGASLGPEARTPAAADAPDDTSHTEAKKSTVPGATTTLPGVQVEGIDPGSPTTPALDPSKPHNNQPNPPSPAVPSTAAPAPPRPNPPAPSQVPQAPGNYTFTFDYLDGNSKTIRTSNNIDPNLVITPQNIDQYTAQKYVDDDVVAIDCWAQARTVNSVAPERKATSNYWFRLSGPIVSWATGTYGHTDMPLTPATHC